MRKIFRFLVVIAILFLCFPAFGWDDEGHMAVACFAYQSLTPAKRARVKALLKLNPSYATWKQPLPPGTSSADADCMIFMIAATWSDQIRTDPSYQDDGPNNWYTPEGRQAAQNIGYSDHLRHKYWHFIDIPYSQDGTPRPATPAPNIETQITAFRAVLASNKSDELKSYDLVWLLHLLGGGVHQRCIASRASVLRSAAAMPAATSSNCASHHARKLCMRSGTIFSARRNRLPLPRRQQDSCMHLVRL